MIWKDFSLYYGAFPDLHRSKALISLVPFNFSLPLFSGIGALLCHNLYCFPSQSQTIFQMGADCPSHSRVQQLCKFIGTKESFIKNVQLPQE